MIYRRVLIRPKDLKRSIETAQWKLAHWRQGTGDPIMPILRPIWIEVEGENLDYWYGWALDHPTAFAHFWKKSFESVLEHRLVTNPFAYARPDHKLGEFADPAPFYNTCWMNHES